MRASILLLFTLTCALGTPAWKTELSPIRNASHPAIAPCILDFQLSWKGMLRAGSVRMEFAPRGVRKPGAMVIKSTASSHGAAAKLFPYSHNYWSEIHPTTLASRYFHATEEGEDETTTTTNRYSSSGVRVSETTVERKSGKKDVLSYPFPHGQARDLFSAILYIRSQKLTVGEEHTLLVLPFSTPYLMKVRVEAKEKHHGRDALRISFSMRKIDRNTQELLPYKKLKRPVTLWLSDDADRIPLEIRAAVYIGDVRAVLTRHEKL